MKFSTLRDENQKINNKKIIMFCHLFGLLLNSSEISEKKRSYAPFYLNKEGIKIESAVMVLLLGRHAVAGMVGKL
jgi:phage-related holin